MAKRNRHKRNRRRAKQQLHASATAFDALQPLAQSMREAGRGKGPVHICGTRSPSDSLTRLQREATQEARTRQTQLTAGEIQHSHMMVQEHFGWTVHTYNPQLPPVRAEESRVQDTDDYVQSRRHTRDMHKRQAEQQRADDEKRAKLRRHTLIRDLIRSV